MTKKHEQEAQIKADKEGLTVVEKSTFDGTFVAPNAEFARYKKLFVEQLDMTDVKIRKQTGGSAVMDTPWELNDADRRYYQDRYTEALMNNLIVDGRYATAMQAAPAACSSGRLRARPAWPSRAPRAASRPISPPMATPPSAT